MEKLKITPKWSSKANEPFDVLFNPTQYSISKQVTWRSTQETSRVGSDGQSTQSTTKRLNAPVLEYGGGDSRILTLNLFFDVTEKPVVNGRAVKDVRVLTNKFVELTRKERAQNKDYPPPVCRIEWGKNAPTNSDFPFEGVITSLSQVFTLFHSDGTPLRANLTISFREYLKEEDDQRETDPEFTKYTVKRGDSLSSIASKMYNDPAKWRIIANENGLDDPRHLAIGMALNIPKAG